MCTVVHHIVCLHRRCIIYELCYIVKYTLYSSILYIPTANDVRCKNVPGNNSIRLGGSGPPHKRHMEFVVCFCVSMYTNNIILIYTW